MRSILQKASLRPDGKAVKRQRVPAENLLVLCEKRGASVLEAAQGNCKKAKGKKTGAAVPKPSRGNGNDSLGRTSLKLRGGTLFLCMLSGGVGVVI